MSSSGIASVTKLGIIRPSIIRLGVNIDHVATLRNARAGNHPDILEAAEIACKNGADSITVHLREDRRHIRDRDVSSLLKAGFRVNLEMAATDEMLAIAEKLRPHSICLVPEKREEQTTEGGLDLLQDKARLQTSIARLKNCGAEVALFIEPDKLQIEAAKDIGAQAVELHTGSYAIALGELKQERSKQERLQQLQLAATCAEQCGLFCHAGHGLDFSNVEAVAKIREIVELNIGYFLIAQALFDSLGEVVAQMKSLMLAARDE